MLSARPVVFSAAAALLLVPLASCGDPGPTAQKRIGGGDLYVALGDSYTAAPGVGESDGSVCERTDLNYPTLLAEDLDLTMTDVSCGSATTADVAGSQAVSGQKLPPQIDAVAEDTDLVTISLGGNDSAIIPILASCIQVAKKVPSTSPTPCADQFGDAAERAEKIDDVRAELTDKLVDVVGLVADAAPKARILLVGYPQFLPVDRGCDQFPVTDGDAAFLHEVNLMLNEGVKRAAEKSDAEYVDVYEPTTGHGVCADDPWVAGLAPTEPGQAFHPYAAEQQAVARAVEKMLDR